MSIFSKLKEKPKALVVGLDGVPYYLLEDLKKKNIISNIASIFESGYFGQMEVCIPEISSVSWSSFMTGTQSGVHGIFGFIDLEPSSYRMCFPNFLDLKARTIWDDLSVHKRQCVVLNMPATYPARKINGALISGFVAVELDKAIYPGSYLNKLNEIGYRVDIDLMKARQDYDYLFKDLYSTLECRMKAVDFLWDKIDWDLFILVITGTDRLMHYLWKAYEDEGHQYHQAFLDYFYKVDELVGRLYDRFMSPKDSKVKNQFFMLSDHGFTGIKSEVNLNRWLQENGYLKFGKSNPMTIMDIGEGSRVFTMDPSRIYINLKDKYPLGTVENADYEQLRREIKEGIEGLVYSDGDQVARKVYLKEELYEGPLFDQAPDLVVLSKHGYDLKGKVTGKSVFERTDLTGMHTQDQAFFFCSSGKQCDSIFGIKRIILDSLL